MSRQMEATFVEAHLPFTLEHNIVYWKAGTLIGGPWNRIHANVDHNCDFNTAGDPITFVGMDLAAWQNPGLSRTRPTLTSQPASFNMRPVAASPEQEIRQHKVLPQ